MSREPAGGSPAAAQHSKAGPAASPLFHAARSDHRSGASGIAAQAVKELIHLARSGMSREELERLILGLPLVQPAMAVLVHLADAALKAIADAGAHPGPALERAAEAFADREGAAIAAIAELSGRWIEGAQRVVTFSASGTVRAALEAAAERAAAESGHVPPVLLAESRPLLEGRDLAGALAQAGLEPTLVVDAALRSLLRPGDLVLVGADRIGWDGWVNKIGTRALVEGAAVTGVPVLVLAPSTRLLPEGVEGEPEGERPGQQVWEHPPPGVEILNPAFESMGFGGVERVVCEDGALAPADVVGRAVSLELDPRLVAVRLRAVRRKPAS